MKKTVINVKHLAYQPLSLHGDAFQTMIAPIANAIGAQKPGYRMVRVPPAKSAWSYHSHLVNEEMLFILEGHGRFVQAGNEYPVGSSPPGRDEGARDLLFFGREADGVDYWDGE